MTPQRRGIVDTTSIRRILEARDKADKARDAAEAAQEGLRAAVVAACDAGGSVREVAAVAGVSPKTVQDWKNARG